LANVWPATQSQLYGELGKLADSGLAEVVSEGARGRREYALTELGLAELRHWLIDVEPSALPRSDVLLRVFFLGVLEPAQVREFLKRRRTQAAAYRDQLLVIREQIAGDTGLLTEYGRLTLEWGLRFTDMQREWAEWASGQPPVRPEVVG
jgi:DNA-binding PadR family transcriptional regulator